MAELHSLKNATKTVLRDIAKHAQGLATGLQNVAPAQEGGPGKTILYLTDMATAITETVQNIDPPAEE